MVSFVSLPPRDDNAIIKFSFNSPLFNDFTVAVVAAATEGFVFPFDCCCFVWIFGTEAAIIVVDDGFPLRWWIDANIAAGCWSPFACNFDEFVPLRPVMWLLLMLVIVLLFNVGECGGDGCVWWLCSANKKNTERIFKIKIKIFAKFVSHSVFSRLLWKFIPCSIHLASRIGFKRGICSKKTIND